MIDAYSNVCHFYQYFYSKVYGNNNYKFEPSQKAEDIIYNYLELINKKYDLNCVSTNFYFTYFVFQFDYWLKLQIVTFSERITIPLILGKKAFDRFLQRDQDFDYKIQSSFILSDFKISKLEIELFLKDDESFSLNKFQEIERKRFYNTQRGFLNCIEHILSYEYRSKLCITCDFKNECKKINE